MQRAIFEKSERARILSQCANLQAQLDASLKDNEILRQQIFDLSNGVQPMTKFVSPIDFKLFRTVSFGSASTCKCIEYSKSHNMYIVGYSRPFPSSLNLSKGDQSIQYGIAKVSLLDDQIIEFLPIHTDHVKAISHCSYSKDFGDSIISTGFDRTLKMTSLATNTVQLEYSLSAQGWSCVFDPIDTNIIYVGLGNGTLCIFDVHRPRDGPIRIINAFSRDGKSIPIHSITVIPEKNGDGKNLILANPMGPFFIYLDSDKCPQRVLYPDDSNIKGDCFALTVDPVTLNFIFLNRSQGAHIFGKLAIPENESNVFIIKVEKTISCERRSGSISHSTMYHVNQKVILAIPDTDYPRLKLLTVPDFVEIEAESTRLPIYGKANAMIFGKSPSSPNGINLGVLFDQTLSIFQ